MNPHGCPLAPKTNVSAIPPRPHISPRFCTGRISYYTTISLQLQELLFRHLLGGENHPRLAGGVGQSPLEPNSVGLPQRRVGGKLDGGPHGKGPRRHNHLAVVARHVPGHGGNKGIHRRPLLDAPAKGAKRFRTAGEHRLDDVGARNVVSWVHPEPQQMVEGGGKHRCLHGAGHYCGGKEYPLVHPPQGLQGAAHLPAHARTGEAVGAPLHQLLPSGDIPGQSIASVLLKIPHIQITKAKHFSRICILTSMPSFYIFGLTHCGSFPQTNLSVTN